jgi:hypothetical protein
VPIAYAIEDQAQTRLELRRFDPLQSPGGSGIGGSSIFCNYRSVTSMKC